MERYFLARLTVEDLESFFGEDYDEELKRTEEDFIDFLEEEDGINLILYASKIEVPGDLENLEIMVLVGTDKESHQLEDILQNNDILGFEDINVREIDEDEIENYIQKANNEGYLIMYVNQEYSKYCDENNESDKNEVYDYNYDYQIYTKSEKDKLKKRLKKIKKLIKKGEIKKAKKKLKELKNKKNLPEKIRKKIKKIKKIIKAKELS